MRGRLPLVLAALGVAVAAIVAQAGATGPGMAPAVATDGSSVTAQAPQAADTDGDGLADAVERVAGTATTDPDSDADGLVDGADPDVAATIVAALPDAAFGRRAPRNRARVVRLLDQAETALLEGRVARGRQLLRTLVRHLDGCPPRAGRNDWVVRCRPQRTVRRVVRTLLGNRPTASVDASLAPEVASLPPLSGGDPRPLGVVHGPDGTVQTLVTDEIVVHADSPAELSSLRSRYDATIVRSGHLRSIEGSDSPTTPAETGWYLLRVDPSRSGTRDLVANLEAVGLRGAWTFSSRAAMRLVALLAREHDRAVGANLVAEIPAAPACTVCEHPTSSGNVDAATWPWFGEGGLSVRVPRAWDYLRYRGFPPLTPYHPVDVAVVDSGFQLDPVTGVPLAGRDDFYAPDGVPPQLDEVDYDMTAGGMTQGFTNCEGCWHAHRSFGVCCANARNGYGGAGTSGGSTSGAQVRTMLIRISADVYTIALGIYDALYNDAEVINNDIAFECGWTCRFLDSGDVVEAAVGSARNRNRIVVVPAGNKAQNISNISVYPCILPGAVCVGALTSDTGVADEGSNFGTMVDIWAPSGIWATVTLESAASDGGADDVGIDELDDHTGTCSAASFLAGIVALMKTVDSGLTYEETRSILAGTANASSDPKVSRGYVNAYEAVQAAAPNQPPAVTLVRPSGPDPVPYGTTTLTARVEDPEASGPWSSSFPLTASFRSDRDGTLCTATGLGPSLSCEAPLRSFGPHEITVTATDAFEATGTARTTVVVANRTPTAIVTNPPDGAVFRTSQLVNLHAVLYDPDQALAPTAVTWASDRDGPLGSGTDLWVSLGAGEHRISATVTDAFGAQGTDSVAVTVLVGAGYPTVRITAPADRSTVSFEAPVTLTGTATDPEDGTLPAGSMSWWSDVDGLLGTGPSATVVLSGRRCTQVEHVVSLWGVDSDGHASSHSIQVAVVSIC